LDKYHKNGGLQKEYIEVFKQLKWKRMGEFNSGTKLGSVVWNNERVNPGALKLGRCSNIHLVTTIYSLALVPGLIEDIFITK
jgi:hypothetical protein